MRRSRRGSRSAEEEAACCRFGLDFTAEASGGTSAGLNQTQNHRETTWIRARPRVYWGGKKENLQKTSFFSHLIISAHKRQISLFQKHECGIEEDMSR